jgi:serine/threonine-protein kinase
MEGTLGAEWTDWVGRVLDGRYRVESVIGHGGMGVMYLATDLRQAGRRVAIKVPLPEALATATFRERFSQEIEQLIAREHPHIVKLYDSGEFHGTPYAVLQYLPGGSLRGRLRDAGRALTAQEVMRWLPGIAEALDFIHREVLHRDVKPDNILFDAEGHVFLADFGIAKVLSNPALVTGPRTILGSLPYIAPEIATGRRLDSTYDQYALAVVVFEALSGAFPHESGGDATLLMQKAMQPPRSLRSLKPDVPPRAAEAVMRALSTDPRQRFESCRQFATAFAGGIGSSRRVWPAAGAAAATLVLAALLGWGMVPGTPSGNDVSERKQPAAPPSPVTAGRGDAGATTPPADQERPGADTPLTAANEARRESARGGFRRGGLDQAGLQTPRALLDATAVRAADPAPAEPIQAAAATEAPAAASVEAAATVQRGVVAPDSGGRADATSSVREFLQRGNQLHERADYQGAIEAFDAALALDPSSGAAREGRDRARTAQQAESRVIQRLTRPD